jgi:hypothetical protein
VHRVRRGLLHLYFLAIILCPACRDLPCTCRRGAWKTCKLRRSAPGAHSASYQTRRRSRRPCLPAPLRPLQTWSHPLLCHAQLLLSGLRSCTCCRIRTAREAQQLQPPAGQRAIATTASIGRRRCAHAWLSVQVRCVQRHHKIQRDTFCTRLQQPALAQGNVLCRRTSIGVFRHNSATCNSLRLLRPESDTTTACTRCGTIPGTTYIYTRLKQCRSWLLSSPVQPGATPTE